MVMCNMDIPRPPPPPLPFTTKISPESIRSVTSQGFRLQENNNQDDTGSVYSIYKQKIDSMFESDSSTTTRNSVQARIEKMFTDVADEDEGLMTTSEIGCHVFSVDYMGSVALDQKVSSLAGLQEPLKELYFSHKKSVKMRKAPTGRMEISPVGLKVQYEGENGDVEHVNAFPTIAVWSAVKFVFNKDATSTYAFLPLITDPDNLEKQTLFRNLEEGDERLYFTNETSHSPLFAVVMRKLGVPKLLECHGFICQTSEDAIVIAATLYKSLMAHMKTKDKKPKNKNGVGCISVASSVHNGVGSNNSPPPVRPPRKKRSSCSSFSSEKDLIDYSDTKPLLPPPASLTKKNPKPRKVPTQEPQPNLDEIVTYEAIQESEEPPRRDTNIAEKFRSFMTPEQKRLTAEIKLAISDGSTRGLRKTPSRKKKKKQQQQHVLSKETEVKKHPHQPDITGDILTKVTIPRSGSFLNAGGLTKYKSKISRANGQATGGSPLGFSELFNEFRLQEGLHSIDEILGVIIDPEGMSFNDLKPIYKEFLLKLALTLTKDELFQRSKAIMRRQKKNVLRRNGAICSHKKAVLVTRKFRSLKHIFHKTIKSKLNKKLSKTASIQPPQKATHEKLPPESSSISTSSYDTRQFRPKVQEAGRLLRKQKYSKRRTGSTSDESDEFVPSSRDEISKVNTNPNRNSSSGYVSCSECSYDSDTCTCASADKCYCSLGNRNVTKRHNEKCKQRKVMSKCYDPGFSVCDWDTDSCTDSNKCYCTKADTAKLLEKMKRVEVPAKQIHPRGTSHRKLCKSDSNTKSSKSLEYMHNPTEEYYQKLRSKQGSYCREYEFNPRRLLDYELLAKGMMSYTPYGLKGKSTSECGRSAPAVYHPSSVRSFHSDTKHREKLQAKSVRSTSITAGACTEALSMKKSAEIAALFADLKLSQTTDIAHILSENRIPHFRPSHHQEKPEYAQISHSASKTGRNLNKSRMYSSKNGLYTIQSQSDDSRKSNSCEKGVKSGGNYFDLDSHQCHLLDVRPVSTNIENSLGYLP